MDKRQKPSHPSNRNWSDSELRAAVDTYVFMLQLEVCEIPFSLKELSAFLENGPLQMRNEASIRYRMRNISHVLFERNIPRLNAFSPASQVGSRVRRRIETLLDERSDSLILIQQKSNGTSRRSYTQHETLEKFNQLDEMLSNLDAKNEIGIGHNNPPDTIELDKLDIQSAKDNVFEIRQHVNSDHPDLKKIEQSGNNLIKFGLKLSLWIGGRITDFSKAAAITAGTGFGAWAVGLAPKILVALQSLASYVQTLLNLA